MQWKTNLIKIKISGAQIFVKKLQKYYISHSNTCSMLLDFKNLQCL